jgi:hypothetical protein
MMPWLALRDAGMKDTLSIEAAVTIPIHNAHLSRSLGNKGLLCRESLPGSISSWFSTAPPTITAAASRFPVISRCSFYIERNPETVKSITSFPYIRNSY